MYASQHVTKTSVPLWGAHMLNLGAFKTGFSGGAAGKKKKNHLPMQEMLVWSVGQEDPLKEGMATHSSVLPGEPHGQRSLVGYSPWGLKELDMTKAT